MTNKFWTNPGVIKGAVIGAVIGLLSASPDSVGSMVADQLNGGAFGALLGGLISLAANPNRGQHDRQVLDRPA